MSSTKYEPSPKEVIDALVAALDRILARYRALVVSTGGVNNSSNDVVKQARAALTLAGDE